MKQPKMTRGNKIVVMILCCIIILGVAAFVIQRATSKSHSGAQITQDHRSEEMPQSGVEDAFIWGQIEGNYQNEFASQNGAEDAIVGKHFTVSQDELARVTEVQMMIDEDNAAEIAQNILIEKYALYYQAQEAGVLVPDEYLDELIDEQIQIFEGVSDNKEYEAYLDGIGMSNEEYWLSRKDELRITESIAAWKQLKRDEFIDEHNYHENPPENLNELWETHYEELVADIIEQEDVCIIE